MTLVTNPSGEYNLIYVFVVVVVFDVPLTELENLFQDLKVLGKINIIRTQSDISYVIYPLYRWFAFPLVPLNCHV